MVMYEVIMPRWEEDVVTRRRTLIHIVCQPNDPVVTDGDELCLEQRTTGCDGDVKLERLPSSAVVRVTVTSVSKVRLVESLTPLPGAGAAAALDDMARLNLMPATAQARKADFALAILAYRRRWNAVNRNALWESNPTVWRIVFRYLETSPELGLAV